MTRQDWGCAVVVLATRPARAIGRIATVNGASHVLETNIVLAMSGAKIIAV